jgi:predicted metal-dependent HD superfamily phosphohydrolase
MSAVNRERWHALSSSAKLKPRPWYPYLTQLYSEPHRRYHTLQHLSECLNEFDASKDLACDVVAVEFAIWFHDAVYDPHASDNEERSAELARKCLSEGGARPDLVAAVVTLVIATKNHIVSDHPDSALLIDIDLSILGQPVARFVEYERQVREEYAWVPKILFKRKRAAILRNFLDRPRLYNTDLFFRKYEESARANLRKSLSMPRI